MEIEKVKEYANYWKHCAGAYKSNIVDFAEWTKALMNKSLLGKAGTTAMWTPQKTSSGKVTSMGLGVFVTRQNGALKISHDGSHNEARSRMVIYPDQRHGMVVFSNCGYADPARISTAVYRALAN